MSVTAGCFYAFYAYKQCLAAGTGKSFEQFMLLPKSCGGLAEPPDFQGRELPEQFEGLDRISV